jgi:hypothetical protein
MSPVVTVVQRDSGHIVLWVTVVGSGVVQWRQWR